MAQQIVVIGAGIAGLASAVALQRQGHDVSVIESRTDTSTGAAITIWPNALAALDEIGLGDAVRDAGGRMTAGAMRWHDGSWLRRPGTETWVSVLGEPLAVVQRSALRDILTGALRPGTIEYRVKADGLVASADGVRIRLADATVRRTAALIGADGIGSTVAHHLNGPLTLRYTGYTAWRGIATCGMDSELGGQTLGPGVEVGHIPMGPDRTYWFTTQRAPEGQLSPEGELPYLRAKLAGWPEPIPSLLAATAPADVLRNDLYDRSPARSCAQGAVVLVGDAAHPMRPHLGQGGCQGLEDAAILAAFVERAADLPIAFERFATFRRPRTTAVVRTAAFVGRLINLRPAFLSAVASHLAARVPEALLHRQLAAVAGRSAFALPSDLK